MSKQPLPAPRPGLVAFEYGGVAFRFDDRTFINLTNMWKAAGQDEAKKPANWRRKDGRGFIDSFAKSLNVPQGHIIQGERGKGGATHAHWQIALAYAKHLSHEFHRFVNEAFRQWAEEKAQPEIKLDRATEALRRKGWSDERIKGRIDGVPIRNGLTDTLKEHGVQGAGYAFCTDAINRPVLGGSAKEIKLRRGLPTKAVTRDHLDAEELVALSFAEMLAKRDIKEKDARGNSACQDSCERAGTSVRAAMSMMSGR